jgi:hypothetical protein
MQENTKGQNEMDRSKDQQSKERLSDQVGYQGSSGTGKGRELDEKSSGVGRSDKSSGLASKDGVTGSDLDGQVS